MKRAVALLAAVCVAVFAGPARADTDLQSLLNESVVTAASKSAETTSVAPATSTTVTAEDMRIHGIHSIDEAIDFLSLGVVSSNTLRASDVGARGVLLRRDQGAHILLLVDGHVVNEPLYGAARLERGAGIPMELVDHIEVILGPGSVLYGSNAMLGVINVVTKNAHVFHGTHVVAETEVLKSYRVAAGAGYEPTLFGTKTGLALELEYYRQDGPVFDFPPVGGFPNDWSTGQPRRFSRTGPPTGVWGGRAEHSYYSEVPSGLLKFTLKNLEVTVHGSTYKRAAPFNHDFVSNDTDFDDPENYELDRSVFVDVADRERLSQIVQIGARVYGDTFDYQRFMNTSGNEQCVYGNVFTCRYRTIGISRRAGAEIQTFLDWTRDNTFVTQLGVDGQVRLVGSSADIFDDDTGRRVTSTLGYMREHDMILGAYLQQTWMPSNWLAANGGGRMDFDQRFGSKFSPRAALSFQTWRGGTLKTIYSEAFRAPSWQESGWTATQQLKARDLRPESVRSVEALIEQKLGSHQLMFGVFRSWWHDLVEQHTLTRDETFEAQRTGELPVVGGEGALQYRNVASIDNYGFNAGYSGSLGYGKFRYAANVTGASARRRDAAGSSALLEVSPQFFGNVRASYALGGGLPTVALAAHYLAKRPADRAYIGFDHMPYAPPQLDVRATLSGPVVGGLSYRASVDYAFASRGAYIVGPVPHDVGAALVPGVQPEFIPVDQFRATVGLQYDFGSNP
jgi:outer membrane cobalamin receptor